MARDLIADPPQKQPRDLLSENFTSPTKQEFGITDTPSGVNIDVPTYSMDEIEPNRVSVSSPDQQRKWAVEGKMGWWEYATRTKGKDLYYGDIWETGNLVMLNNRLKDDEYVTDEARQKDIESLREYMVEKEELEERGLTWGTQVFRVLANMPTFAAEMYLTGGLATATRAATKKAAAGVASRIATKTAKNAALRYSSKAAGVLGTEAAVAAARLTVMPHRYVAAYGERQVNHAMAITDKGIQLLDESTESPITSFLRGSGDLFVEYYSETLGGELLKPAGRVAAGSVLNRMPKKTAEAFKKVADAIINKIPKGKIVNTIKKSGFDGIVEEYGEERLGGLFRTALGLDERDIPVLQKLQEAVFPGWEQALVEIGAFSIWGGSSIATQKIYNTYKQRGSSEDSISNLVKNLSQTEREQFVNSMESEEGLSEDQLQYLEAVSIVRNELFDLPEENRLDVQSSVKRTIEEKGVFNYERDGKPVFQVDARGKRPKIRVMSERGVLSFGGKDFDEEQIRSGVVFKALSGAPLAEGESELLQQIKTEFEEKGLIGKKEETAEGEEAEKKTEPTEGQEVEEDWFEAREEDTNLAQELFDVAEAEEPAKVEEKISKPKKEVKQTRKQKYEEMVKKIQDIKKTKQELEEQKEVTKEVSQYFKDEKQQYKHRIRRYADGKLDEEYNELPVYYRTKEGGITLDEAAMEAGFESDQDFLNHLIDIDAQIQKTKVDTAEINKSIIEETQKKVVKSEVSNLKQRISDYKAGKLEGVKDLLELRKELRRQVRKSPQSVAKKMVTIIDKIKNEKQLDEAQSKFNELIDQYVKGIRKGKAIKKIAKEYKKSSKSIDVEYQEKINEILTKLGGKKELKSLSVDELEQWAERISALKEVGKSIFKSKKEQRRVAKDLVMAALVKATGGVQEGLVVGTKEEKRKKKASKWTKSKLNSVIPVKIIRDMFGEIGERILYDSIHAADTIENIRNLERKKKIDKAMIKHGANITKLSEEVEVNGKTINLNSALRLYLATKDKQSLDAIIAGNGFTQEDIDGYMEYLKTNEPQLLEFADEVQKIVAERYSDLSKTMKDYFNVSTSKVAVYFPLNRVENSDMGMGDIYQDIESNFIFEAANRSGQGFSYTSTEKGFTIDRKTIAERFQTSVSLNFIGDAIMAIQAQEHLMAFAGVHKAFNQILRDGNLQNSIKYNYSEQAWRWLDNYLNVAVNPSLMYRTIDNEALRQANGIFRKGRVGLSKAYLGFNVVTALKQFPSLFLGMRYTTPKQIMISLQKSFYEEGFAERIYEMDPSLRNRVISRDYADLIKTIKNLPDSKLKAQILEASQKIDKWAFSMMFQVDKLAVLALYDAVYQHQRQSVSENEAKYIATKAILESQPQGAVKDLPAIYRTNNESFRMMLMFTNQLNKIWSQMVVDIPQDVQQKEFGRMSATIAGLMMSNLFIYILSEGRLPEDEDDLFFALFGGTLASVPFVGNWMMAYARGYDPSISPAESVSNNLKWLIHNVQKGNGLKIAEQSLFLIAILAQKPYSQIRRTIKGGAYLAENPSLDIRPLMYGPPKKR